MVDVGREMNLLPAPCGYSDDGEPLYLPKAVAEKVGGTEDELKRLAALVGCEGMYRGVVHAIH